MALLSLFFTCLIVLFSTALQIASGSMVISWSRSDFVVVSQPISLVVIFSLGIAITITALLMFILLMIYSRSKIYLWIWISFTLIFPIVGIGLTSPKRLNDWIKIWNKEWTNTSHTQSFQYESNCCGWENFLDRSIADCPFSYRSGCRVLVEKWIRSRFDQIFLSLIFDLVINLFPIGCIMYCYFKLKLDVFWTYIKLPFVDLLKGQQ